MERFEFLFPREKHALREKLHDKLNNADSSIRSILVMELKLGPTLKRLIRERGLKTKQVAKDCGIPLSSFSEWLNNRSPKNPLQAQKVAQYFQVSLHYLLFGVQDPNEKASLQTILKDDLLSGIYEINIRKVKIRSPE